jgi:hypothetical protein
MSKSQTSSISRAEVASAPSAPDSDMLWIPGGTFRMGLETSTAETARMINVLDHPLLVFALSFFVLWLSTRIGASFLRSKRNPEKDIREDFATILATTLTLNALIIGFTFSMAIGRYDQRKNYEAAEANAIGTEYVRADLLPPADAARVRSLLRSYLDQRVSFYTTRDDTQGRQIQARTAQLQTELWGAVLSAAPAQPTPIVALAIAGMNDVLNSQGYTQAAWWNRIPAAAWILMAAIAVTCNLLLGYGAQNVKAEGILLMVPAYVVSISFFLIADIDSPRGGVIRVNPQNLTSLVVDSPRAH